MSDIVERLQDLIAEIDTSGRCNRPETASVAMEDARDELDRMRAELAAERARAGALQAELDRARAQEPVGEVGPRWTLRFTNDADYPVLDIGAKLYAAPVPVAVPAITFSADEHGSGWAVYASGARKGWVYNFGTGPSAEICARDIAEILNHEVRTALSSAPQPPAGEVSEQDAKDARRYRWLRENHSATMGKRPATVILWNEHGPHEPSNGAALDAAIDAAIVRAAAEIGRQMGEIEKP